MPVNQTVSAVCRAWLAPVGAAAAAALLCFGAPPRTAQGVDRDVAGAPPALGMNLSSVTDWNREWVFVDVFRHSRSWIPQKAGQSQPWSTQEPLAVTDEGWPILNPGQAAATLMCRDMEGHYPNGTYTLTYEGQGDIFVGLDAKRAVQAGPNHYRFDVVPGNGGIYLRIDRSDRQDPVRNINVWMPDFEQAASAFHPLFIERLRPFKVIRFMDWQRTNNSRLVRWTDRTRPDDVRQSGPEGVAVEYMIDLCNESGADPWFCMPHLADDDFVRNFASLVKQRLAPQRTIYVEWSNEAWNSLFSQGRWVHEKAKSKGVADPQITADEARRDWRLWHEVFGDQADRVVRVAAGHLNNPWVIKVMLEHLDGEFDAVACAPYFGPGGNLDAQTTTEQLLRGASRRIDEWVLPRIAKHRSMADRWRQKLGRPLLLLGYEAGQAILPIEGFMGGRRKFVSWKQAAWECQTHPMMYDLYKKLLNGCAAAGVDVVVAFNYVGKQDKWGSWGHLRYQDESLQSAPKFRALLDAVSIGPSSSGQETVRVN